MPARELGGDKPMTLPPVEDSVCDASMISVDLSSSPCDEAKPSAAATGWTLPKMPMKQSLQVTFERKPSAEPKEQHMSVPSIHPIEPLDEREVKEAHKYLRRKVRNHVVPWLFVIVLLIAMCGRNQGVAALSMAPRLGFSDAEYGFGSSIFYAGFIATQLPSIWLAKRIGVPSVLAVVLLVWSATTAVFALLPCVPQGSVYYCFCLLRIILGAAEGALIPAMYFYLTTWYGSLPDNLASMHGQVTIASQVAGVLGGVVAAKLLLLDGVAGLDGWQWLYLLEAVPLLLAALVTPFMLARDPEHARWLDLQERKMLAEQRISTGPDGFRRKAISSNDSSAAAFDDERMAQQRAQAQAESVAADSDSMTAYDAAKMTALVLTDPYVAYLAVCVLLLQVTLWSLLYWQPLLIGSRMPAGSSDFHIALISALPLFCGVVGTLLLGTLANNACCDRRRRMAADAVSRTERRWHSSVPMILGGAALSLSTTTLGTGSLITPLVLLCVANGCLWAVGGLLSTWPTTWLNKQAAVVALAILNMASAVGGLVGPALVGILTQAIDGDDGNGSRQLAESGSGAVGMWEGDAQQPPSSSNNPVSLHAAVGVLGGCAIAAGLLALFFQPTAAVPAPPDAPEKKQHDANTVATPWHPEVDVAVL